MRARASLARRTAAALGPLLLTFACSIYDDSLLAGSGRGGDSGGGRAGGGPVASGAGQSAAHGATNSGGLGTGAAGATGGSTASTAGGPAGGSAGTSAEAGAAGTSAGDSELIDDMEDNEGQINVSAGRDGFWYVGNDGTVGGTQTPPASAFAMFELEEGERLDSLVSAHMLVEGFTSWGSVIGFNLDEAAAQLFAYDASAYCGLRFWARAAAATSIRVSLADGDTHPAGKTCVETGPASQLCYDHFGATVTFTAAWKQHTVLFSALAQLGTGYHPADMRFKAESLFSVEWAVGKGSPAGKLTEIWIDDVEFVNPPAGGSCD